MHVYPQRFCSPPSIRPWTSWSDLRADPTWAGHWTRDLLSVLPTWIVFWFQKEMWNLPKGAETVCTSLNLSLTNPWPNEDLMWENTGHKEQEKGTLPQRFLGRDRLRGKQKFQSISSNLSKSIWVIILYGEMVVRNLTLLCVILDRGLETFPWIFIQIWTLI